MAANGPEHTTVQVSIHVDDFTAHVEGFDVRDMALTTVGLLSEAQRSFGDRNLDFSKPKAAVVSSSRALAKEIVTRMPTLFDGFCITARRLGADVDYARHKVGKPTQTRRAKLAFARAPLLKKASHCQDEQQQNLCLWHSSQCIVCRRAGSSTELFGKEAQGRPAQVQMPLCQGGTS